MKETKTGGTRCSGEGLGPTINIKEVVKYECISRKTF